MATRAEIEAEMAAKLGTAPVKRTRAQIEAEMAAKLGAAPAKKVLPPDQYMATPEGRAELEASYKARERENSFLDNMAIGSGKVVADMGRGFQQLGARVTGDDARLSELQAEEADVRKRMDPVTSSAGGITGNILTNAAMFALPGAKAGQVATAGTTAAKFSPKVAAVLGAMLGEGVLGAASGAVTPTVEGESTANNMKTQAALGAATSTLGPLLRSQPVQKMADTVLDYTPLVAGARRRARNATADAAYNAEKTAFGTAKEEAQRAATGQYEAEKAAYKTAQKEALERTRYATALRDQGQKMKQAFLESQAQKDIAAAAGFTQFPKNKVEFVEEIKKVGAKYGELIAPIKMQLPDMSDILEQPGNAVSALYKKLQANAVKNAPPVQEPKPVDLAGYPVSGKPPKAEKALGPVDGETYKAVRADAVEALGDAQGDARVQLRDFIDRIDRTFESAIPPDKYSDVVDLRGKYAIGSTIRRADWKPGEGADIGSVRKRLDSREIGEDVRKKLYDTEEALAGTKDSPALDIVDAGVDMPMRPRLRDIVPEGVDAPIKPVKEVSDPFRLGAVNVGLAGGLSAMGAPALPIMVGLPLTAAALKQANNPRVAKMANALRRGATIGYGTVLAPGEED